MSDVLFDATPPGFAGEYPTDGGPTLLTYPDGTARLRHTCDRGHRGVIVCAPLLQLNGGHNLTFADSVPTVTPSCGCEDCGLHGFITDGQWRTA